MRLEYRQQPDTYHWTTLESLFTYFKELSLHKVLIKSALPRLCTNSSSCVDYNLKVPLLLTSSNDSVTKKENKQK